MNKSDNNFEESSDKNSEAMDIFTNKDTFAGYRFKSSPIPDIIHMFKSKNNNNEEFTLKD